MPRTEFVSTGFYVPDRVVTNHEITQWWDTSDEWIRERTGIRQRYWVRPGEQAGSDLALEATKLALERAGMKPAELDRIIYATLSPDYFFPGSGVYLQRKLGVSGIPALDLRNQCSGFLYGLSVADAWIRAGQYRRVLLVGAEVHSTGVDFGPEGRDRYGNTAAATIPIAIDECVQSGQLRRGDFLVLTAFGSGFTWASAVVRW